MKLKTILSKVTAIVAVAFIFGACDDDFSSVGSEVIGDVNFQENQYASIPVAYTKRFEKVQSSSLPNNLLGFYDDPFYGESAYSVVSQIQPSSFNPDFGENPVLKSVVISIPYYITISGTEIIDNELFTTYKLDSIYGNDDVKLSIYKSNYFLRDFDADQGQTERQVYYSNDIEDNFGPSLEDKLLFSIDEFKPTSDEVIVFGPDSNIDADTDPQKIKLAPRLRFEFRADEDYLDGSGIDDPTVTPDYANDGVFIKVQEETQGIVDYFQEQIIDKAGSIELSNQNNFNNYFRGIYFKAEKNVSSQGNLIFFDMSRARLTLSYVFDKTDAQDEDDDGDTTDTVLEDGEFEFTFRNNVVNSFNSDFSSIVLNNGNNLEDEINNQDTVNGAENLYLKGGEGSYAIIDLFNKCVETDANGDFVVDTDGNPVFITCTGSDDKTELDFLKDRDWLINNASLKFYIDQNQLGTGGATEPERVYLFNPDTGGVLVDYFGDVTANNTNSPVNSTVNHLGRISRGTDQKGVFYNIVLTRHLINVLNGDTANIKLALSVSQNVNVLATSSGFTSESTGIDDDEIIPFSSIISHEGTVLYGNGSTVPEDKRLKLDIFYTESKTD